ncbi:hypothetical protein EI94DRAFT_1702336 [Lactarius quietus]|nr:hypothetical protein EI94DRAFT_1702336 [Lactarius quietus]
MPKKTPQHLLTATSNARAARRAKSSISLLSHALEPVGNQYHSDSVRRNGAHNPDEIDDKADCGYEGGVDHSISSDDEYEPGLQWELEGGEEWDSDEELSEYDKEQMERLQEAVELVKPTPFEVIALGTHKDWRKIEANRSLGYNGQSKRTWEWQQQQDRLKQSIHEATKMPSDDPQVMMMHNYFIPKSQPIPPPMPAQIHSDKRFSIFELMDYPSDEECDEYKEYEDDEDEPSDVDVADVQDELLAISDLEDTQSSESARMKQRKLDIPVRVQKAWKQEESQKELQAGLDGIRAMLHSKKNHFTAEMTGLQSYRVRAIQSHLLMLVKNGYHSIEASERAAKSQGFTQKWGGRNV